MVLGVGDEQRLAIQEHSLRPVERCLLEVAVLEALLAAADRDRVFAIQAGLDDPVVTGISDEEPLAGCVGDDLTRVEQRAGDRAFHFRCEGQRAQVELALRFVHFNEVADRAVHGFKISLAAGAIDISAVGVDQDQRRPAIDHEAFPDRHVGVVDDGMLDPVFGHLTANVLRVALGVKLGGVHADHHELVLVLGLELGQIRKNVMAVNAAKRPEIKQHDLAVELGKRDWTGIDPVDPALQARTACLAHE